jgi:hypothetical protein
MPERQKTDAFHRPKLAVAQVRDKSCAANSIVSRRRAERTVSIHDCAHRLFAQDARVLDPRSFLMTRLQRVAEGGDIVADDLSAGVPDPSLLDPDEREAFTELQLWIEDHDIHQSETNYSRFKREWMRDRLAVLRDAPARFER